MRNLMRLVAVVIVGAVIVVPIVAYANPVAAMKDDLYQRARPNGVTVNTVYASEIASIAKNNGYSIDLGTTFKVSRQSSPGLSPVHRLWNPASEDYIDAVTGSDVYKAAVGGGYEDQGVRYYALSSPKKGKTEPVYLYIRHGKHRLATETVGVELVTQGWTVKSVVFHVPLGNQGRKATRTSTASTPLTSTSPAAASQASISTAKSTQVYSSAPPSAEPNIPTGPQGSVAVGGAAYIIPPKAIFVSPSGNDAHGGTRTSPVRSIQRALSLVPVNGTVVVRGGTYHETVAVQKSVTIQNYPNETVWLDGSSSVTGWVAEGGIWRLDGWTTRFDASPSYTRGGADGTSAKDRFLQSDYPMAAHPDQLFVDGVALRQVASKDLVRPGTPTFYYDQQQSLYSGVSPTGKSAYVSALAKAIDVDAANVTVRGIGIRRYAPSVHHRGAVVITRPGARFENVVVTESATTGIGILAENVALTKVTVHRSGMVGIHAHHADGLNLTSVLSTGNNTERFTFAVAGGVRLGYTRGITVNDSNFSGNAGHGFWEDSSCFNSIIRQSKFTENDGAGMLFDISAKIIVGDNVIARNAESGIKLNNVSDVQIWNNTFTRNGRPLNMVQDVRRNENPNDAAVDKRIAWPDPAMPWTLGPVTIRNNVVANSIATANCLVCVEDYSRQKTAEQMQISSNGNIYHRSSTVSPTWLAIWSRGAGTPSVYTSLGAFQAETKQDSSSREYVGNPIVSSTFSLDPNVASLADQIAEPLPATVAAAIGRQAGSKVLGRWS